MKAEIYRPAPALQPYIEGYVLVDVNWAECDPQSSVWRLLPYGQASFLFLYGDLHEYSYRNAQEAMLRTSRAFLVGQLTQPIWLKFSGCTRLIKVQVKPAGMSQLLPLHLGELTDVPSLDLEAVWGRAVPTLVERLHDAATDADRIQLLDAFLQQRLLPQDGYIDYVQYTVEQLQASGGSLAIQSMEQQLGISRRHLERLFRTKVGLAPKELGKIIRLNQAFQRVQQQPSLSMTALAHECGYFDQAHFSRDFLHLTGARPSKLLAEQSKELFVTHGRCFTSMQSAVPQAHA
jgi:AraC-like DNA-binding protein